MNSSCILPMYTLEQLKHSAKLIRKYLETLNIPVSHSTALDIASNGIGFQNYNIAKASIEKVEIVSSEYMIIKPNFQATGVAFNPDKQPERFISIDEFKREMVIAGMEIEQVNELASWHQDHIGNSVLAAEWSQERGIHFDAGFCITALDMKVYLIGTFFDRISRTISLSTLKAWQRFKATSQYLELLKKLSQQHGWKSEEIAAVLSVTTDQLEKFIDAARKGLALNAVRDIIMNDSESVRSAILDNINTKAILTIQDDKSESAISVSDKDAPMYEFVKPEKMPTTGGFFGFNKKARPLSWEDMAYNGKKIPFINNSSTILMANARFGKTTVMRTWAEELTDKGIPFVYFLTGWHFSSLDQNNSQTIKGQDASSKKLLSVLKPIDDFTANGESALIKVWEHLHLDPTKEISFESIKGVVESAMEKGYHIFIDENKYRFNLLEMLQNRGYNNFTIALQGFASLKYDGRPLSLLRTDRILIGKSHDYQDYGYESIGIKIPQDVLYRLPVGHFMIARRS